MSSAELSETKRKLTVVKNAVKAEQSKSKELTMRVQEKHRLLEKRDEEIENLNFNNVRLTKRVAQLMKEDSQAEAVAEKPAGWGLGGLSAGLSGGVGWLSGSGGPTKEEWATAQEQLEVLQEQLQLKIQENETVHITNFDQKSESDIKARDLEATVAQMRQSVRKVEGECVQAKAAAEVAAQALRATAADSERRVQEHASSRGAQESVAANLNAEMAELRAELGDAKASATRSAADCARERASAASLLGQSTRQQAELSELRGEAHGRRERAARAEEALQQAQVQVKALQARPLRKPNRAPPPVPAAAKAARPAAAAAAAPSSGGDGQPNVPDMDDIDMGELLGEIDMALGELNQTVASPSKAQPPPQPLQQQAQRAEQGAGPAAAVEAVPSAATAALRAQESAAEQRAAQTSSEASRQRQQQAVRALPPVAVVYRDGGAEPEEIASSAALVNPEVRDREELLREYYERQKQAMLSQLELADSKAVSLHTELGATIHQLGRQRRLATGLQQQLRQSERSDAQREDELSTTRGAFEQQVSIMTESMLAMNETARKSDAEIGSLRNAKVLCGRCAGWNTVAWLQDHGQGGQRCSNGAHEASYRG